MAKCTNKTFLMIKRDGASDFEKLIDITQYPDLGGARKRLT